jgi:hypothetical protein
MSDLNDTSAFDNGSSSSLRVIPHMIRFWSYLFSDILSLLCTLFTLYCLLHDRALRQALNNHIIIVLLIIGLIYELTDIPWILRNSHYDVPWLASPTFYLFWVFFDYAFYSLQIALFAWATIERHILIFHESWVSTKKKRFFVHYFPIGAITIYYIIYYSMVHFVPNCENSFDAFLAGSVFIPCSLDRTFLGLWDLIVHQVIPTFIIVIFCAALLLRVVLQKRRMNQPVQWRKYRKMTIQLLTISTIYMLFNAPWVLTIFAYQYGLPDDIATLLLMYMGYLTYYVIFSFPFVCCLSLPELRTKIQQIFFCKQVRQRIGPSTAGMTITRADRVGPANTVAATKM